MKQIRTHYMDASAIVKLLVQEDGSEKLRSYYSTHNLFSTTSICIAETLGVLKSKYIRNLISQEEYLSASEELMAILRDQTLQIEDVGISERQTFSEVEALAKKYNLDISDCYQLVTLKRGFFSQFTDYSQPILITADKGLSDAAKKEGLHVWDCLREIAP